MAAFVRLLGSPAVKNEEGWLEPPVGKLFAILYYLACQGGWVSRNDLLYLFRPRLRSSPCRRSAQLLRS